MPQKTLGSKWQTPPHAFAIRSNKNVESAPSRKNVVTQYCNQVSAESQGGNAVGCEISDVVQENTMKVANDCTQKAVVTNKAVQDLQQTMDQLAVAKTVGLDLMSLFIAIAIICGVIVICATKAVGSMARHVTAIAGIVMLVAVHHMDHFSVEQRRIR